MAEPLRPYRDTLPKGYQSLRYGNLRPLTPCGRIEEPQVYVGLIGLKRLVPDRFRVRGALDRQPIILFDAQADTTYALQHPGKSAFLHGSAEADKKSLEKAVRRAMDRPVRRHDHLHLATVGDLEGAGWQTWWAPLPKRRNLAHVRLVAARTVTDGVDPTEADRIALTEVFVRII